MMRQRFTKSSPRMAGVGPLHHSEERHMDIELPNPPPTKDPEYGYPVWPIGYCYNCGSPDHYATNCPFPRQGQGAPRIFLCQNCQEYGHTDPQCQKPMQARPVFKQVDPPPREQTGFNYAHTAGTENPEK